MCGLAGYIGVTATPALVRGLGVAIDRRGGHGVGYVRIGAGVVHNRRPGYWSEASRQFIQGAIGSAAILHSRFATCATKSVNNAHPFAIKRNNRTVLWGAHNGVIYDAENSAKANGRPYSVDSKEVFELLADGLTDKIRALNGYGVLMWIERGAPDVVKCVRLTDSGELYIAKLKGGGCVWGSTKSIVQDGLKDTDLEALSHYDIIAGKVHEIRPEGLYVLSKEITVQSERRYKSSHAYDWRSGRWSEDDLWTSHAYRDPKRTMLEAETKVQRNAGAVSSFELSAQDESMRRWRLAMEISDPKVRGPVLSKLALLDAHNLHPAEWDDYTEAELRTALLCQSEFPYWKGGAG